MLRGEMGKLSNLILERGPGRMAKPPGERLRQRDAYAAKVEEAYLKLCRASSGAKPSKTDVAKELGEGGVNPKSHIDSSLQAFRNKLDRHELNYDEIIKNAESKLNNNS